MSESGLMSRAAVAVTAGASLAAAVTSLSLSAVASLESLLSAESVLPESVDEVSVPSESVDEVFALSESDWLDEVSLLSLIHIFGRTGKRQARRQHDCYGSAEQQ